MDVRLLHINLGILFLACAAGVRAQGLAGPELHFDLIDSRAGLSNNITSWTYQDHQGFLWIATGDGLNRFDGYSFKVYRHDRGDATSLSNNTVWQMLEDARGNLWVFTRSGWDRFDRRTERFHHYPPVAERWSVSGGLSDEHGAFWSFVDDKLFRYDDRAEVFRLIFEQPQDALSGAERAPPDHILSLYRDRQASLWISTARGLLYRFSTASGAWKPFASPWRELAVRFEDTQGRLWLQHDRGTGLFHPETGAFEPYVVDPDRPTYQIRLRDGAGRLWFTDQGAVLRYDPVRDARRSVVLDPPPFQDLLLHLYEDRTGGLWFSSLSGLYHLPSSVKPFHHLGAHDPNGLSHSAVMAVYEGRDGMLWVGTLGGGLNRVDPRSGRVTRYRRQPEGLCHDSIWSLFEDRRGTLWIGTDQGLCALDPSTERFHAVTLPRSATWGPPTPAPINAIREDEHGQLWLAGNDGLYRLEPATNAVKHFPRLEPGSDMNAWFIQALHIDRSGRLWVARKQGGLYRFDPETETATAFPALLQAMPVTNEGIWMIHEDGRGVLWLGSDHGLTRFDPATGTVRHYTEQDGLPASIVYAILEDEAHHLWLSTNNGLVRFRDRFPDAPVVKVHAPGDGLKNDEFNRRAAFRGTDGSLFFGGMNGLTAFDPESIRDNPFPPPVALTQIEISNRDSTFSVNPFEREHLVLSYRDYTVAFAFAALNFTNPAQNRYAYQLEGFDEGWIAAGTRRRVQYTSIPPGTYSFRVKASNNDGVWNEVGTALRLTVTPPFWETWWFRLLVVGAVAALLAAAYRYRVAHLLEIERMRMRIARDLHDDIGSGLSSIALASELVSRDPALDEEKRQYLSQVTRRARLMAEALTDIVWLVDPARDRLGDLVEHMETVAADMLAGHDYSFHRPGMAVPRSIDLGFRRHLHLIFKEILHNIVKHAQATTVTIQVDLTGGVLELRVADDGTGFAPDRVHHGNGLGNMRKRAAQIGGALEIERRSEGGTAVRLTVPLP